MVRVLSQPLIADDFAPFGQVLEAPAVPGRRSFDEGLANLRPAARPGLSFSRVGPRQDLPLRASVMERHQFSSQSFIAIAAARWVVIVAPNGPDDRPDTRRMRAFIAGGGQGVTYGPGIWHHPLSVLDAPAAFAVLMWRDGSASDEEFTDIEPVTISVPEQ